MVNYVLPCGAGAAASFMSGSCSDNKPQQKGRLFTAGLPDWFGQFYRLRFKFHLANR